MDSHGEEARNIFTSALQHSLTEIQKGNKAPTLGQLRQNIS